MVSFASPKASPLSQQSSNNSPASPPTPALSSSELLPYAEVEKLLTQFKLPKVLEFINALQVGSSIMYYNHVLISYLLSEQLARRASSQRESGICSA